ncbi:MAG: GIY-YIG nuclease family protein, partial [Planctomycetota bacterium]
MGAAVKLQLRDTQAGDDDFRLGFGADPMSPHPPSPIRYVTDRDTAMLRHQVLSDVPNVPGVYGMLDRYGSLIYVGKSKQLRSRLLSYFSAIGGGEKAEKIILAARAIQWETQPSEFAALLREQFLIRKFTPRWNVQEMPKRLRPMYLCLGRQPAASFFTAALPPADCVASAGPFHGAGKLGLAVDVLNKYFRLRDCRRDQPMHFIDQLSLFDMEHRPGCLRFETKTCSGPCAGGQTTEQYDEQVRDAERFLEGFDNTPTLRLKERMQAAANNRQYELAGRILSDIKAMEFVHRRLDYLARARRDFTFVYRVRGFDLRHTWYWIRGGEVCDMM